MPNTNSIIERLITTVLSFIDRLTGGVKSINTDHYYIHRGIAYEANIILATVGATALEYSFKTPASLYPHFKNIELSGVGGTCRVTVMRGTTANPLVIDSAGAASVEIEGPYNLNDNFPDDTGVVMLKTPTYTDDKKGEPWQRLQIVGSATNQYKTTASLQSNENKEIVMQDGGTYYVIKIERIGTDSPANVMLTMFWYEEDEGALS